MCYRVQINADKIKLQKRFNATFQDSELEFVGGEINGFSHPNLPVITDRNSTIIQPMEWGLLPSWAADKSFQKNTLNCKIETAAEKPTFRNSLNQRCLILVSGFYEWKHVTEGKKIVKQKFLLTSPNQDFFTLAGLYNNWNGTNTFTILTTEANELMAEIIIAEAKVKPNCLKNTPDEPLINEMGINTAAITNVIAIITRLKLDIVSMAAFFEEV